MFQYLTSKVCWRLTTLFAKWDFSMYAVTDNVLYGHQHDENVPLSVQTPTNRRRWMRGCYFSGSSWPLHVSAHLLTHLSSFIYFYIQSLLFYHTQAVAATLVISKTDTYTKCLVTEKEREWKMDKRCDGAATHTDTHTHIYIRWETLEGQRFFFEWICEFILYWLQAQAHSVMTHKR